ncbi:hypothetical protein [Streptomyces alboniger]|uniref:Regulatory protein n=1 Tax=Streptomyces alboniger TaxID=132473 RepID=A0A5J6HU91_STRAD|nr:hypothetical protein [Streptomyces alboniger]QEV22023.1 hypothetical protein CP975_01000 [Streptomyces alboniger]
MSESVSASELTSQYAAQVRADLEHNAKEQQRLGAEIAALQEQLEAHQRNHAVLVSIQQAIGAAPASAEPAAPSVGATVPAPRTTKKTTEADATKRGRAKKTRAASQPRRGTTKPTAEKGSGKAASTKATQPTLVDLIRNHLSEQSEPRSAAEITSALAQAHPDRSVKTTVVRTTVEGLVAKSQAQRSKQGSSVFYTASAVPDQAAQPKPEEQPAQVGA